MKFKNEMTRSSRLLHLTSHTSFACLNDKTHICLAKLIAKNVQLDLYSHHVKQQKFFLKDEHGQRLLWFKKADRDLHQKIKMRNLIRRVEIFNSCETSSFQWHEYPDNLHKDYTIMFTPYDGPISSELLTTNAIYTNVCPPHRFSCCIPVQQLVDLIR